MITPLSDYNVTVAQQHIDELRRKAEIVRLVRASRAARRLRRA
jgi:hypothetical protein